MAKSTRRNNKWSFLIDRGGTFTDILAITPGGEIRPQKLLSENPDHYKDAAIEGIRRALDLEKDAPIPSGVIETVRMGTTVATNALLEHKGEATLLVTSKGLKDCLAIGTQARADIFALNIQKTEMLYSAAIELEERILECGTIATPLDETATRTALEAHYKKGLRAIAILFMHAYKYPAHEQKVAAIAREIGYTQISASHQVSPLIKYIPRGDTTMVDAYLTPTLHRYTRLIDKTLDTKRTGIKLFFMTSNGALSAPASFDGKDAILSGPAGGIVGAAETASAAGHKKIICFDMGGTSTDVAHYSGTYDMSFETEIAGHRLQAPMLDIHTVAAGGGSILSYENNRLKAGPESAGANPGPMSYRGGGPLTITDANLMTGRIDAASFPHIFGPDQNQPLDQMSVSRAFNTLAEKIDKRMNGAALAEGFIDIANENMTAAIRKISVERGIDVSDYALQCYGGAGGQHAAAIAEKLGISKIFIHAHSGLLSAYGMGCAREAARARQMISQPLAETRLQTLQAIAKDLQAKAIENLADRQDKPEATTILYLAYKGTETRLPVTLAAPETMRDTFEQLHKRQFGYLQSATPIMIEQLEVEVKASAAYGNQPAANPEKQTPEKHTQAKHTQNPPAKNIKIYHRGRWLEAALYDERGDTACPGGQPISGPALIVGANQTIFVPPAWQLTKSRDGHMELTHAGHATRPRARTISTEQPDPIQLELFNSLFMSIAEQMGEALRATARSVNIKERLDYSCAVFAPTGDLIANAPHMPVHLGSMDEAVKAIIRANAGQFTSGEAFMTNAPYNGGTHLPDITVIKPVFKDQNLIAFVAARGHHADIGGIAPGSMSPNAQTIDEEGVNFDNIKIVENGEFQHQAIRALLTGHRYPARAPDQNIADLKAQLIACTKGAEELLKAADHFGQKVLTAYMGFVQSQAEIAVKALIQRLASNGLDGRFEGQYSLTSDQGHIIKVAITPDARNERLTIDFTGTSPQSDDNFNAPAPVTRAAVLYVLRTLIEAKIPMNAGCLRPVDIIIPPKSLLAPVAPAAVVAGNVETSQLVTNCLYGAFGMLGLAQGTMNNLTFGDETHQYYETICSGAPAGPGFDGAAAIHTHMTNSRLTDPEILETRYPVMLREFSIRPQSGGKGEWCAGDGVKRSLTFLKPLSLAILSGQRAKAVAGVKGGEAGEPGQNILETVTGSENLPASCAIRVNPGDTITIITPTGGGYGPLKNRS